MTLFYILSDPQGLAVSTEASVFPEFYPLPVIVLGTTYGSVFVSELILTLGRNFSRRGLGLCHFFVPFYGTRLGQSGWSLFMGRWSEWP